MSVDPKIIFGNDPQNYDRARINYPQNLIAQLVQDFATKRGVDPKRLKIVDIGAGTGGLGKIFLDMGCHVDFIEPSAKSVDFMKEKFSAAIQSGQASVGQGEAEQTGLPDKSVDLIVMGDAAHWVDVKALKEFRRIAKDDAQVMAFSKFWSPKSAQTLKIHQLLSSSPEYRESPSKFLRDSRNLSARHGKHLVCDNNANHISYVCLQKYTRKELLDYFGSISFTTKAIECNEEKFIQDVIDPLWQWAKKYGYLDAEDKITIPYEVSVYYGPRRQTAMDSLGKDEGAIRRFSQSR